MDPTNAQPHVVIVGGGIAGLAAAFFLRDEPVRVTVLEGSPRLGRLLGPGQPGRHRPADPAAGLSLRFAWREGARSPGPLLTDR